MMRVPVAHLCSDTPNEDGTWTAVTILNRAPHGIMVWAGRLGADASFVSAEDVAPRDYMRRESVSFMAWPDALEYFKGREVEPLLRELMWRTSRRLRADSAF